MSDTSSASFVVTSDIFFSGKDITVHTIWFCRYTVQSTFTHDYNAKIKHYED